jgi:G3E family GTPase
VGAHFDSKLVNLGKALVNLNAGMSLRPVSKAPSIDRISSLVLRTDQPLDIDRLSEFMNELLEDHGKQLLRYKGVLNIAGEDRRMVFQGVLKLYGFDWDTEWEEGESAKPICAWAMVWVRWCSAWAASTRVMMPSRM